MFVAAIGALVATAAPPATLPASAKRPVASGAHAVPPKGAMPDLATLSAMFDKFFPPQPDLDPVRLALARTTVREGLLPAGSFATAFGSMMGTMVDRVLAMRESDFAEVLPPSKRSTSKPASTKTLHEELLENDPYFDERMRLTRAAVETELLKVSAILEPRLQEGLSRAVARRFDQRQLADFNAFFATDSGRALGRQYMALWFDPDLTRSMITAIPDMIALAPGAMERIGAATANLPKPRSKSKAKGETPAKP